MKNLAFRVLNDPPLNGPSNMARDEALLLRVGRGELPPTLRLYQWDPPTISLGYFQRYADFRSLPAPAGTLPVVRRLTGGGAILHDWELTYSLTLPTAHALLQPSPNRLYEMMHDVVIAALAKFGVRAARCGVSDDSGAAKGPFFCFARRHCYDVLVRSDKLAGSAQRRTRPAVLQHGSIVLGNRFSQQPTANWLDPFGSATSPRHEEVGGAHPTVAEALPTAYAEHTAELRERLVDEFVRAIGGDAFDGTWGQEEIKETQSLQEKYSETTWTQRV